MHTMGMSQTRLAQLLGVTQGYISRVVNGHKNFTIEHLETLSDRVHMPMAVLIYKASRAPVPADPQERAVDEKLAELMELAYPEHFRLDEQGGSE